MTCMEYYVNLKTRCEMYLIWGDTAGDIHALELNFKTYGGLFGKDENRDVLTKVTYKDLLHKK